MAAWFRRVIKLWYVLRILHEQDNMDPSQWQLQGSQFGSAEKGSPLFLQLLREDGASEERIPSPETWKSDWWTVVRKCSLYRQVNDACAAEHVIRWFIIFLCGKDLRLERRIFWNYLFLFFSQRNKITRIRLCNTEPWTQRRVPEPGRTQGSALQIENILHDRWWVTPPPGVSLIFDNGH